MTTLNTLELNRKQNFTFSDQWPNHLNINLKDKFNISYRFLIKQTLPWALAVFGIIALFAFVNESSEFGYGLLQDLDFELSAAMVGILAVLVIKVGISALYRHRYQYYLERGHLVIVHGTLLLHKGSYPLSHINDIYCTRDFLDLLLGLHTVVVCTPTLQSENFARISGLGSQEAHELSNYLVEVVEDYQIKFRNFEDQVRADLALAKQLELDADRLNNRAVV